MGNRLYAGGCVAQMLYAPGDGWGQAGMSKLWTMVVLLGLSAIMMLLILVMLWPNVLHLAIVVTNSVASSMQ